MRCKIVRFQKLMWRNMIKSTKSKKASVLHYSIDIKYRFVLVDVDKKQTCFRLQFF